MELSGKGNNMINFMMRLMVENVSLVFDKSVLIDGGMKIRFAKLIKDSEGIERFFYQENEIPMFAMNASEVNNDQFIKMLNRMLDNYLYTIDKEEGNE